MVLDATVEELEHSRKCSLARLVRVKEQRIIGHEVISFLLYTGIYSSILCPTCPYIKATIIHIASHDHHHIGQCTRFAVQICNTETHTHTHKKEKRNL